MNRRWDRFPLAPETSFLEPPQPRALARMLAGESAEPAIGSHIGPYELLELIASGGMGSVYLARRADATFEKRVAIKVIRGHLLTDHALQRFQIERQALANLEHPAISRLLDGGTTAQGLPYLVMEYIDGQPIDRSCDEQRLGIRQRLVLFREVCAAVQEAHRNLVVHRDLKPGNILVTACGQVKLVDFGISRLLDDGHDDALATATALRALTPGYSSPEQIRGEPITTATDVYSLGVVLYELLCGQRPHRVEDLPRYQAERVVCEVTPALPSAEVGRARGADRIASARGESLRGLRRTLAGDLDNVVMKALHREAVRRYQSVEQLSEDLRRYLEGHPVLARQDAFVYRAAKFVRRNRHRVAAAAALIMALVTAMVGVSFGLVRARFAQRTAQQERNAALEAKADAQQVLAFYQDLLAGTNPYRHGRSATVLDVLEDAEQRIESDLAGKPQVEAGVRLGIARTYVDLMLWKSAVPHLRQALHIYGGRPGSQAVQAECLSMLGRALTHLREAGAVQAQERALAIRRTLFGAEHATVAESTGNLGYALWASGPAPRWQEAERQYREALGMYERLGLADCRDAARFTMSLAHMYVAMRRPGDAEPCLVRALEIYDHLPVAEDVYEFATLRCYAELLAETGRIAEAVAVLEKSRSKSPQGFLVRSHRDAAWRLAQLRSLQGDLARAARDFREALAIECDVLRACGEGVAEDLASRSERLRDLESGPASAIILEALPELRRGYRQTPLVLAERLSDLASLVERDGDRTAARRLLLECLDVQAAHLPPGEPALAATAARLDALDHLEPASAPWSRPSW